MNSQNLNFSSRVKSSLGSRVAFIFCLLLLPGLSSALMAQDLDGDTIPDFFDSDDDKMGF